MQNGLMNNSTISYPTSKNRAGTSKRRRLERMQKLNRSIHFR